MHEVDLNVVFRRIEGALDNQDINLVKNLLIPALDQFPDIPQLWYYAGAFFYQQEMMALARVCYEKSNDLEPNQSLVLSNLGAAGRRLNDLPAAIAALKESIECAPEHANAWGNLGAAYVNEGDPDTGIAACNKAIEIRERQQREQLEAEGKDPNGPIESFPRAYWNKGLMQLEKKEFKEGFRNYRAGLAGERMVRMYEPFEGKLPDIVPASNEPEMLTAIEGDKVSKARVIVWGEQGIGDELMFATALPMLLRDAGEVIFECHPRLIGIYEGTFEQEIEEGKLTLYPTRKDDYIFWPDKIRREDGTVADYKMPIGDLGWLYLHDKSDFLNCRRHKIHDTVIEHYGMQLDEILGAGKLRVGLAWTGGIVKTMRTYRSMPLPMLAELGKDKDIALVSLQYEDDTVACEIMRRDYDWEIAQFPAVTQHYDYLHTAGLVANLDVVVTVCQSVAHLAASMGKQVIVLTPSRPAWRYGLQGDGPITQEWYWYQSDPAQLEPGAHALLCYQQGDDWEPALREMMIIIDGLKLDHDFGNDREGRGYMQVNLGGVENA